MTRAAKTRYILYAAIVGALVGLALDPIRLGAPRVPVATMLLTASLFAGATALVVYFLPTRSGTQPPADDAPASTSDQDR